MHDFVNVQPSQRRRRVSSPICPLALCRVPYRNHSPAHVKRTGVSLLEVMFSIGIVMIGLVGIAALIPVAGAQARKGAVAAGAANLGQSATHDFHVRGMAQPWNWRWFDGANFVRVTRSDGITPLPGESFCIDARLVGATVSANDSTARSKFPLNLIYDNSLIVMRRVSLASQSTPSGIITPLEAEQIFLGRDDLVFDLPSDRTRGPVQNFALTAAADPVRRNVEGRLSWMATVVPRLDRVANPIDWSGLPTREYILSIVVFHRRVIDRQLVNPASSATPVLENTVNERVVFVRNFYSGTPAFSGGDVQLMTRAGRPVVDLELRSGDWVLLSAGRMVPLTPPLPSQIVNLHRWYRVANVDEAPSPNGNAWVRDVTLVGPDWDWQTNVTPTQVTIVRGVTAVFEKTIQLETSSLWTP
jgi:Tfp pilus assembly protein PilV